MKENLEYERKKEDDHSYVCSLKIDERRKKI